MKLSVEDIDSFTTDERYAALVVLVSSEAGSRISGEAKNTLFGSLWEA